MIANRAVAEPTVISASVDFNPVAHNCDIAECGDWGNFGIHEFREKTMIEHWFCSKHRPAQGAAL